MLVKSLLNARLLLLMLCWLPFHVSAVQWPISDDMLRQSADEIRTLASRGDAARIDGIQLALPVQVERFYQQRDFQPAWIEKEGIVLDAAELLGVLQHSEQEGLPVQDYPVAAIDRYLHGDIKKPVELAKLDLLLTDAFLHYARNVHSGRFTPRRAGGDWFLPYRRLDATELLSDALTHHTMSKVLASLPPSHDGYRELRTMLNRFRTVAAQGGWAALAGGETLREGSSGERVLELRKRLQLSGDLAGETAASSPLQFDASLSEAVIRFQRRHGLKEDGVVGGKTLAAMNLPVETRIREIEINMERWRWLPETMPSQLIMVNMAGYELEVFDNDKAVMTMRVIVGRDYRQTPVLAGDVTTLVLNPIWYVPPTIIRDDILPKLRVNSAYLKRLHLRLYQNGHELNPSSVDWSTVDGDHFPYTLLQEPGPQNPLGRIKFLIPDSDGIYLHDTPDHGLFNKNGRALSSGCIRLEHPLELALYLLADPERWSRATLDEAINSGKSTGLVLSKPMPIYFTYWTTWVDQAGVLQFRPDVYHRDRRLMRLWEKSAT